MDQGTSMACGKRQGTLTTQGSHASTPQSQTEQAMSILARTKHVDLTVTMPSYDGHVGEPPRPMTRVEEAMLNQFPGHSQLDSEQVQHTRNTAAVSPAQSEPHGAGYDAVTRVTFACIFLQLVPSVALKGEDEPHSFAA
eukprot:jgi/Ulvmu1/2677/UM014_0133.1